MPVGQEESNERGKLIHHKEKYRRILGNKLTDMFIL